MLRLKDIKFESEPRRQLRPTPAPQVAATAKKQADAPKKQVRQELSWLGADCHNLIMACVRTDGS